MGLFENIKDTRGNTVEKEGCLILQWSGGCNSLCAKQTFSFDTFCQKGHTYTQVEVQCIDRVQFSDTEILKLEELFLAAKILLNAPAGKIQAGSMDEVLYVPDLTICDKHQRMIRQTVNDDNGQVRVSGRQPAGDLTQAGDTSSAMTPEWSARFPAILPAQFLQRDPRALIWEKYFTVHFQADHKVLPQFLQLPDHIIVVVTPIHDKCRMLEIEQALLDRVKGHISLGDIPGGIGRIDF